MTMSENKDVDWDSVRRFSAPGNFGDGLKMGTIQAFEVLSEGGLVDNTNYEAFYDLETYLFETVQQRFQTQGRLSTFDFFCIVIWKANRAKTKIARRLSEKCENNLDLAVYRLTSEIFEARIPERQLYVLMHDWGFLLPMASAILTVLYPAEFTIYDVRVCDALNDFHKLSNTTNFPLIWEGYVKFVDAVKAAAPQHLSLRDKDRYLWGKSFFEQLKNDVYNGFSNRRENSTTRKL